MHTFNIIFADSYLTHHNQYHKSINIRFVTHRLTMRSSGVVNCRLRRTAT